jgi:ketosteroid isomerase-like protein
MEQRLLDRLAVRDLIDRSSDAINHQDWTSLVSMMAEDAVWERLPPTPWTLEGRDAIRAFLANNVDVLDILLYTVSATAIEVEGPERASARSTMSELLRFKKTGAGLHVVGTYHDRFVKKDGQWWFARRTIQPRYEEDVAAPKQVVKGHTPP